MKFVLSTNIMESFPIFPGANKITSVPSEIGLLTKLRELQFGKEIRYRIGFAAKLINISNY